MKSAVGAFKTTVLASALIASIFLILALTGVLSLKGMFKEGNINRMLNQIDLVELLGNANGGKTLDEIYSLMGSYDISKNATNEILNSRHIKEELSTYIQGSVDHVVYSKEMNNLTKDSITASFSESIDEYNRNNEDKISNITKGKFLDLVDNGYKVILSELPTQEKIDNVIMNEGLYKYVNIIGDLTKPNTILYLVASLVLTLGIVSILCYTKWIIFGGFSFFISASVIFVANFILISRKDEIFSSFNLTKDILYTGVSNISSNLYISAFILLLISLFMFFLHSYYKKMHGSENKKINNEKDL